MANYVSFLKTYSHKQEHAACHAALNKISWKVSCIWILPLKSKETKKITELLTKN